MQTAKWFGEAFRTYLSNPVLVLPYLFLGILSTFSSAFTNSYLSTRLSDLNVESLQATFLSGDITTPLIDMLLKYALVWGASIVVLILINSFVAAYAIELSRSIVASGHSDFRAGFFALGKGLTIFVKEISMALIILAGAALFIIPGTIFFGTIGSIIALLISIVYFIIIYLIFFFADQAIVLSGKGAWGGIVQSYNFIRQTVDSSVILMLFMLFFFAIFALASKILHTIGATFLCGTTLGIFSAVVSLALFSGVVFPFFVVLKTTYYMKK